MTLRTCIIVATDINRQPAALAYSRALVELGIDVDLVGPVTLDSPPPQSTARLNVIQFEQPGVNRFSVGASLRTVRAILSVLKNRRYDIVHVSEFRGCSLLPILGRNLAKAWFVDIRTGNVASQGMRSQIADWLTAQETRPFSAIFVIDTELGRRLLGSRPFYQLEQGTELSRFADGDREGMRRRLDCQENDSVILYTGALDPLRRPFNILECFAQVAQSHPTAKLLLVGDSDLLPQMRAWVAARQLTGRVLFAGRVPYDVIQDYLAAADIGFAYVPVTPNFEHNPPLKTVEFLAAGLPTVATDTHGNRVYITHEQNGLLAPDDPRALAQTLCRLLEDRTLAVRLAAAARLSVMDYDWQTIVRKVLLPIYRRYATH